MQTVAETCVSFLWKMAIRSCTGRRCPPRGCGLWAAAELARERGEAGSAWLAPHLAELDRLLAAAARRPPERRTIRVQALLALCEAERARVRGQRLRRGVAGSSRGRRRARCRGAARLCPGAPRREVAGRGRRRSEAAEALNQRSTSSRRRPGRRSAARRSRSPAERDCASPTAMTTREPGNQRFGLTERETDVLRLLAETRTNREIGEALFISPKTVSVHVTSLMRKLGVRRRADVARLAKKAVLEQWRIHRRARRSGNHGMSAWRHETQENSATKHPASEYTECRSAESSGEHRTAVGGPWVAMTICSALPSCPVGVLHEGQPHRVPAPLNGTSRAGWRRLLRSLGAPVIRSPNARLSVAASRRLLAIGCDWRLVVRPCADVRCRSRHCSPRSLVWHAYDADDWSEVEPIPETRYAQGVGRRGGRVPGRRVWSHSDARFHPQSRHRRDVGGTEVCSVPRPPVVIQPPRLVRPSWAGSSSSLPERGAVVESAADDMVTVLDALGEERTVVLGLTCHRRCCSRPLTRPAHPLSSCWIRVLDSEATTATPDSTADEVERVAGDDRTPMGHRRLEPAVGWVGDERAQRWYGKSRAPDVHAPEAAAYSDRCSTSTCGTCSPPSRYRHWSWRDNGTRRCARAGMSPSTSPERNTSSFRSAAT